MAAAEKAVQG